ncbi:MAG: hypothetical protein AB1716_07965 [Planctomycetota bacterium]
MSGAVRLILAVTVVLTGGAEAVRGDLFGAYALRGAFDLPAVSPFDVLADGRLVTLAGADVYTETGLGTRSFSFAGRLAGMDVPPYAAAFVRVSPDGSRLAVGNNGGASYANFKVGVFDTGTLAGGWFPAPHYEAEWFDGTRLGLTAGDFGQPSRVTMLDVTSNPGSPVNTTVVRNIGGAASGVTFDRSGRLYTGNGYAGQGPSGTGWIKAFEATAWQAALGGGPAVDFEGAGTLVADVLSAGSLGFDVEGNLHVGGGDFLGGIDVDYAGLVRHTAVAHALGGGGPAGTGDIRRFDPDSGNPANFYDVTYNAITGELYVRENARVWVYDVPEPAAAITCALVVFLRRR